MTETTTTTTTTDETTEAVVLPEQGTMGAMALAALSDHVEKANALAKKILDATVNRKKAVFEAINDPESDDEDVKRYLEYKVDMEAKLEKAYKAISEKKEKELGVEGLSEEELKSETEKYNKEKQEAGIAEKFVTIQPGYDPAWLKNVPAVKSIRSAGGGSGKTGSKRPRISQAEVSTDNGETWTDVFETKDGENYVNYTILAQYLSKNSSSKVEPKDLISATFAEAKTDSLNDVSGSVDFGFTSNDKNYRVRVTPETKD